MVRKFFKALIFDWRKKRAIKKAQEDAQLYGKKFLVLTFKGKPTVVSKQGIKKMIREGRFSKDLTIEKLDKLAIYTAMPKPLKK